MNKHIAVIQVLRNCLAEIHQEEIDNLHYGDNPDRCSYCIAIAEADQILAEEIPDYDPETGGSNTK
jgi:hypothetical protein